MKAFFLLSLVVLLIVILWTGWAIFVSSPGDYLLDLQQLNWTEERVVYALAADPANPDALLAGVWNNAVYSSTNGGQKWTAPSGQSRNLQEVLAIARPAQGGGRVYAGTTGGGVYRSDDNGQRWRQVSSIDTIEWVPATVLTSPMFVSTLLISDSLGEILYVGTLDGVRKTIDGGTKWHTVNDGLASVEARFVETLAQERDNNILYAGTWGGGVYRSANGGEKWLTTTLAAQGVLTIASLLVDPANGAVYAGSAGRGVYKSVDWGETWLEHNTGITNTRLARTIQALAVDGRGTLYAGTVDHGVYTSTDGGANWHAGSQGLTRYASSILNLVVAGDGKTVYAGTLGGGIYRSQDGGTSWEEQNGNIPLQVWRIQVLGVGGLRTGTLYAGTHVGGMYLSRDGGENWKRENYDLPIGEARSIQALDISGPQENVLHIGTRQGLYRATDDGTNLSWVRQVLDRDDPTLPVTSITHHGSTFYAGVGGDRPGIYRQINGADWQPITRGLDLQGVGVFNTRETGINLALGEGDALYASIWGKGVYVSRDGGDQWELVQTSFPFPFAQGLDSAHKNWWQQAIWTGPRNIVYARTLGGIYAQEDNMPWSPRFPGDVGALLADPFHPRVVYAGVLTGTSAAGQTSILGVLMSQDDGQNWKLAREMSSTVTALTLNPYDRTTLYIGTSNRGVYKSQVVLVSWWRHSAVVGRVGVILLGLILIFDLLAFSYGYRISPLAAAGALARPVALSRLLVDSAQLPPLHQLILAYWPSGNVRPEQIQKILELGQATTSWIQLISALDDLVQSQHLAKAPGGAYRIRRSAFAGIARWRFMPRQEILSKGVREESQVYLETHEFFQQAGFVPRTTRGGLFLLSPRGGIDAGVYAGVFGASPLTTQDVNTLFEYARDEYHGQVEGRSAYAVIAAPPHTEAYRRIVELATEPPHFRIIPLSHIAIRQARTWGSAAAQLARSEARVAPEADLYALDGPAIDPLDFFGRRELIQQVRDTIEQDRIIGLSGMPRIGKTSLLWQLRERLGDRPCAYIDLALLSGQPGDLARALISALSAEARVWEFSWQLAESPDRDVIGTIAQIVRDFRDKMPHRLSERPLVLLVDTVATDTLIPWNILIELSRSESRLQVALGFADRGTDLGGQVHSVEVVPFAWQDAAELAQTLLRPLGSTFQMQAVDRLYLETAGHPQLLRQLCSEIISGSQHEVRIFTESDVADAARRYLLKRPLILYHLWEFLTPTEQSILLYLAKADAILEVRRLTADAQHGLDNLACLGWVRQDDGRYRIASELVRAWLNMTILPAPSA